MLTMTPEDYQALLSLLQRCPVTTAEQRWLITWTQGIQTQFQALQEPPVQPQGQSGVRPEIQQRIDATITQDADRWTELANR